MRTSDAFEDHGRFWLTTNPATAIPGLLRVRADGRSELELMGVFGKPIEVFNSRSRDVGRVIGQLQSGSFVTLDGCSYVNKTLTIPGGSKCMLKASIAFVGVGFDDSEAHRFTKARFSFEGLDEWLAISGIQVISEPGTINTSILFNLPDDIRYRLPEGFDFTISFGGSIPFGHKITEAKVTQKAYMNLTSATSRELDEFLDRIFAINHFLCFGTDEGVDLDSLVVLSPDVVMELHDGEKQPVEIKVFYESRPHSDEPARIKRDGMLFAFPDVATNFEHHLTLWLDLLAQTSPAYFLYYSSKSGEMPYLANRFLALAQGVETLHRRTADAIQMPPEEFEQLVELLAHACPASKQQWLKGRLKYANEVTLRRRLMDLLAPFKHYLGSEPIRKKLINSTTETRHYLTHYDEGLADKAAKGQTLWRLCERLEALFQLHLMKMIGFDDDLIERAVRRNERLSWKLRAD